MKRLVILLMILLVVGCQADSQPAPETDGEPPSEEAVDAAGPAGEPSDEPVASADPQPEPEVPELELVVSGPEEMVFDWTSDRCEDESIPDIAARAWRDANGTVNLTIGHLKTYVMTGPDLNNLTPDCSAPVFTSDLDPEPSQFNDGEWLGSVYTEDGQTVYGIVHSEYRGHLHPVERPGQCPSGDYLTCLDTALTLAKSTDGGRTFTDVGEPPNHMIATLPYQFDDTGVPSGLRQPSNVVRAQDGYYYVFSNISDYPPPGSQFENQRPCVMRTDNLDDPKSWRYWDGRGFDGVFRNPYVEEINSTLPVCLSVDPDDLGAGLVEGISYNETLEKYVVVGMSHPLVPETAWGVYYSLSDDLIDWTPARLLLELPLSGSVVDNANDLYYAYPTLMDPDSPSLTFDTSDDNFYLYLSRFNAGGNSLDRDVLRYPVSLAEVVYDVPQWEFNTDGDLEGWEPIVDIDNLAVAGGFMTFQSSGGDPTLHSRPLEFPASQYDTISITMKVSPGEPTVGQIFFTTDGDTEVDEPKSIPFDVIDDDLFHTYELDMASVPAWRGLIRSIRFDPVTIPGRAIEIDRITIGE